MVALCVPLAFGHGWSVYAAGYEDIADSVLVIDGRRYYLDADNRLLNTDQPVPEGYRLNEEGQLIDENTYPNEIILPEDRDRNDRSRYPLSGLREQLWLSEARINAARSGDWYIMSSDFDKQDFYNTLSGMRYGSDGSVWPLIYLLSGEEPSGYQTRIISTFRAEMMEQTADVVRNFLNSFDWRNASDYDKVCRVLELVCQASYDYETLSGEKNLAWMTEHAHDENGGWVLNDDSLMYSDNPAYQSSHFVGNLVNKLCICEGYAEAFAALCRFMGMEVFVATSFDCNPAHAWDFVKIDGTWYTVDATSMTADTAISHWLSKPAEEQESVGGHYYNLSDYIDYEYGVDQPMEEKVWSMIR